MESIAFALTAISGIQQLIQAGGDAMALINATIATMTKMQAENRDPTQAERAALDALIAAEMAKLLA